MNTTMLWGFWALSLSFTLVPGMDWAYVMSGAVNRRMWTAMLGMLLGYAVVIGAVMAGVGAIILAYPPLLNGLTLCGVLYLIWLGIGLLRAPATVANNANQQASRRQWVAKGIAVSGLNPKVLLMFLTLVPQFFTYGTDTSLAVQTLTLGSLHLMNCALIYPLVGLGVGMALRYRPSLAKGISRFSGVAMVVIAVGMAVEQWGAAVV